MFVCLPFEVNEALWDKLHVVPTVTRPPPGPRTASGLETTSSGLFWVSFN